MLSKTEWKRLGLFLFAVALFIASGFIPTLTGIYN